jgi:short-subunit dehydrogenase
MNPAVAVTGASGGIGGTCVTRLLASGFTVLAAVRSDAQADGSGEGFLATPLNAPYCMAKHALEAFSEALRLGLVPSGVSVYAVIRALTSGRPRSSIPGPLGSSQRYTSLRSPMRNTVTSRSASLIA